jgi:hypothetical protein
MSAPPSAFALQRVISLAMSTIEALRTEHGQVIETDDDVVAALAQEGVSFEQIMARLGRAALQAKADAAAADAIIDDLRVRRDRFRKHEEAWRAVMLSAMEAVGLTKLQTVQFSVSITPGKPRVLIVDETLLPDELVTVTVTRTPDRVMIKQALYDNGEVPGAVLSNSQPVITVRTR